MSTPENAISTGHVRFFDNYLPPLEADDYTITVNQTVNSSDSTHPLTETFTATQTFSVLAPRFALPSADVQSVFPPQNATGVFDQNFAHIVLNERVLPWERLIDNASPVTKGTPWIALLLLTEDEILPPVGTVAPSSLTNPTLAGTYPVSSDSTNTLLKPLDPATLGPTVIPETTDETTCKAIDIPTAVFERVVPHMEELPFLAHVREAAAVLEHKTTDQASGDGWFSVVLGNRFPAISTSQGSESIRNIAHLVSLEGFSKYLCGRPAWPSGITNVRLVSLQSWSFVSLQTPGNFAALASNLVASPIGLIQITNGGSGYASAPAVSVEGGSGSGALLVATVTNGAVSAVTVVRAGTGYTSSPSLTFTSGGGTGAAATANLLVQGGDMLRLRLSVAGETQTANTPKAHVQTALQEGYAALAYDTRVGDTTFGWYHGPFVPNPVASFSEAQPFASSAGATIYDKTSGTFDLSYATGWETGRMLALASRSQSNAKMALAKSLRKSLNLLRERSRLNANLEAELTDMEHSPEALQAQLEAKRPSRSFVEWMSNNLGSRRPVPGMPAYAPCRRALSPVAQRTLAATHLRSMGERPEVHALLRLRLTTLLNEPQFSTALDWQAGLRLLEGVPFSCLVPNAAMLPPESIRFFYVDPNYLNALTDGANSIGLQTTRDQMHSHILRSTLREAAIERAQALRPRRIGRSGQITSLRGSQANDPVAGFLLRSALVSGWPGLEVKAYSAFVPNSDPLCADVSSMIPPLRLERLAPDVLLCLYPQIPVWIELDEPKEGLAFGVEDPAQLGGFPRVALRYLDNSNGMGKTTGTAVEFTSSYYRYGDPLTRVVDITAWQTYLSNNVPSSTTAWGPAAFAIQMVRAPEQMIFQTQPNPAPPENS